MNKAQLDSPRTLVDIDRYPVDGLDSDTGRKLVKSCQDSLAKSRFFALPGFITRHTSELMAAQGEALLPESHFLENRRTVYLEPEGQDAAFSPEHPRNRGFGYQTRIIGCEWIPESHAIRKLYQWEALPRFLAAALNLPTLYPFDDPYQATTLLFHEEGQKTPWHFDSHDFTVTLLLQQSVGGGNFELIPDIRNDEDENYDGLSRVFNGDERGVVTVPRYAGELVVFKGRHSIHRVTRIEGGVRRIIAIMSFVHQPGMRAPLEVNRGAYGPRVRDQGN